MSIAVFVEQRERVVYQCPAGNDTGIKEKLFYQFSQILSSISKLDTINVSFSENQKVRHSMNIPLFWYRSQTMEVQQNCRPTDFSKLTFKEIHFYLKQNYITHPPYLSSPQPLIHTHLPIFLGPPTLKLIVSFSCVIIVIFYIYDSQNIVEGEVERLRHQEVCCLSQKQLYE